MKIAQFPAIQPRLVAGQRKGGNATEVSRGSSVLREQVNNSSSKATFADRSQQLEGRLSRSSIPVQLVNQKAIDVYRINSTYSLFGGDGELIGVDLHA